MDNIFILLGQIVGAGIPFIILFAIVEYIPPLKRYPRTKYSVPTAIGGLLAIGSALGATADRGAPLLASVIAIVLAIWYAVGGLRNARNKKSTAPNSSTSE
ncbi:MAG: hypothetical protein WAW87_09365 [Candidatus Ferrigenium altingense]